MQLAMRYLISSMKTIEEIRVIRLRQLIREYGSASAVNRAANRNERDSTLSQILTGAPNSKSGHPKTMGSEMARALELALKKPRGWMDNDPDLMPTMLTDRPQLDATANEQAPQVSWPFSYLTPDQWQSLGANTLLVEGFAQGLLAKQEEKSPSHNAARKQVNSDL